LKCHFFFGYVRKRNVIYLHVSGIVLIKYCFYSKQMLRARCMLYCICRKPFDPGRMIACYQCNEWYHFDCMKLSCTQDIYICPACTPCTGLPTNHDRSVYCMHL
jgi:hypothetical protein